MNGVLRLLQFDVGVHISKAVAIYFLLTSDLAAGDRVVVAQRLELDRSCVFAWVVVIAGAVLQVLAAGVMPAVVAVPMVELAPLTVLARRPELARAPVHGLGYIPSPRVLLDQLEAVALVVVLGIGVALALRVRALAVVALVHRHLPAAHADEVVAFPEDIIPWFVTQVDRRRLHLFAFRVHSEINCHEFAAAA